uniref:adenylate dimethylallyltransferase (ADP/ATP-dependent) n=2 Tax=Opuntia streptacantha TaxID=393608 RepID=A0A7C9D9J6_OPUST
MKIPTQMWKQTRTLLKIPTSYLKMEVLNPWRLPREKVVFIMGATGTGKSRLSIDLATRFPSEIINSDKIQVYKGLDIVTNKVTKEEQCGFPHHLLGIIDPNCDFSPKEFCLTATHAVESIHQKGKLPIVVGGSNSYIKSLVLDPKYGFRSRFDCCFLWVDVSVPVLHNFVSQRVDKMVEAGLVDEVRGIFDPNKTDYSRGIRRAIGVPELDTYLRAEKTLDEAGRAKELHLAIQKIKENTSKLVFRQLEKIRQLENLKRWDLHRLDATEAFRSRSKDEGDEAWEKLVARPSEKVVNWFLSDNFSTREVATRSTIRTSVEDMDHMVVSSL